MARSSGFSSGSIPRATAPAARVYLDYAGFSPVDPRVVAVMRPFLEGGAGNPSALHSLGLEARASLDGARAKLARLFAAAPAGVIFTATATEANNLAIAGITRRAPGRHLVTSAVEHVSVLNPCRDLEKRGWEVTYVAVDGEGRVDPAFDFYVSTSSQQHKKRIEERLKSFNPGGRIEVRVVEQNRGRDMSSLFITFRDVMLSGEYAWALRLHTKRTPQMPWQVGQSFKRHLIENLVPSKRFVASLFDLLEQPEYRNVGMVVPPVVHIGFGTLGHSWYSNRKPLEKLAKEMKIDVPLDRDTPVAAYGTMYWFRPKALELMFRYDWKWEDYNVEPNHIDGGLAHVQERLLCYCAQQQGFRTLAVMSTGQAAKNYLKLEYKHQILSSCLPVRDIRLQYRLAKRVNWQQTKSYYTRFLDLMERNDERFHRIAPKLWARSRVAVDVVWPMLKRLEK